LRLEAVGMSLEEIFLRLTTTEDALQDTKSISVGEVPNSD